MIQEHEPLLPDARLARITGRLRRDFPALSEEAEFVTFIQPSTYTKAESGIDIPIPEVAVFAIVERNPRHADYIEITPVNVWFATWREHDKDFRHSSEVEADPAYRLYRTFGVPAHLNRIKNLKELN